MSEEQDDREEDLYLRWTTLAKVRAIRSILRDLMPARGILTEKELRSVGELTRQWEERIEKIDEKESEEQEP